jgi:hypothetical protein
MFKVLVIIGLPVLAGFVTRTFTDNPTWLLAWLPVLAVAAIWIVVRDRKIRFREDV